MGAAVAVCARTTSQLAETVALIQERGGWALAIPADMADRASVEGMVGRVERAVGPIDLLVNNAGVVGGVGPLARTDPDAWWEVQTINLRGPLYCARAVLPGMKERGWGRILNVTSISVKQPVANLMLSNSLRAAVTGMARTLATEVAPFGVTVNNILPGYTRTERVVSLAEAAAVREGISAAAATARWEAEIPMRRLGEPREFAALAAFLCSERASYITGTSVPVDGGWIRSLL